MFFKFDNGYGKTALWASSKTWTHSKASPRRYINLAILLLVKAFSLLLKTD